MSVPSMVNPTNTSPTLDCGKVARWKDHRARLADRISSGVIDLRDGAHAPAGSKRELLAINDLAIHFGGVHALRDVSVTVSTGEVTGVIGPNGAGKTTLFNCISGLLSPDRGDIVFDGHHLKRMGNPMLRARLGIGRTFQTPRLFRSVTVLDNLLLGCRAADMAGRAYGFEPTLGELPPAQRARRIAERVGYLGPLDAPAGSISFGEMRVVELARALCASPSLLMLDEPASGLDVAQAGDLVGLVRDLADLGLAVLLIEHDMSVVMGVCEQITVLDFGAVIARGTPLEIQENQDVLDAYLGKAH
ncbi:MAG TPA: ABC transporter ATP-binding protein [Acidimicrobiia bacterium]|nr:ABC transporter ATP-binding protein [Acidimicrobiia bacterium]